MQGEPLRIGPEPDVQGRYRRQPVHGVQATRGVRSGGGADATQVTESGWGDGDKV